MEELSIEEKAKAYDEALERARIWKDKSGMPADKQGILDDIFPELAGSEDEQIRKELTKHLKEGVEGYMPAGDSSDYQRWLVWLEKQSDSPIKWNKNTKDCKPKVSHSVLMKTTHGIAEGEWQGEHWHQYRWASLVRDTDVLSWIELSDLEKQGEYAENNEDDADIDFTIYHPLKNGKGNYECIPYSFYGTLSSFSEDKDIIDFLRLCFYTEEECNEWIKQNESTDTCDSSIIKGKKFPASEKRDFGYFSKPTDKVEPKFKVGQWYQCTKDFFGKGVTFDKNTAYYCAKEGCLQDEYGCHIAIVKDLYDNFKLWTIEDAKDGDVLVGGGAILMFRRIGNIKWDDVIDYHCYYDCYRKNFIVQEDVEYWGNTEDNQLVPATKEQRDFLFKKMKEAGYEWDAEKKKLKKISQRMISAEAKEAMYDKPACAWSEEDENRLSDAVFFVREYQIPTRDKRLLNAAKEAEEWLKSLKERIGR